HHVARGATLRRRIITVPARLARPARTPILHLPRRWPRAPAWLQLWQLVIGARRPATA
ncbi:MAG TPA: IS1380 family transposase, partial [Pseudonocardiaceae bacterium]|nr:IS1380 family transposase [Pseudonocardiaceae bacterium]